jgi:hypothetical protein
MRDVSDFLAPIVFLIMIFGMIGILKILDKTMDEIQSGNPIHYGSEFYSCKQINLNREIK